MHTVLVIALVATLLAYVQAQVGFVSYNSTSCQGAVRSTTIIYKEGECKKFMEGIYYKASCNSGSVKFYAGMDATCPDDRTITIPENSCFNGLKLLCNYSPTPEGMVSKLYHQSNCTDSPTYGLFQPSGCHPLTSTLWQYIACPTEKVQYCPDATCSRNCFSGPDMNKCMNIQAQSYQVASCVTK
jgi:hypothetical protein